MVLTTSWIPKKHTAVVCVLDDHQKYFGDIVIPDSVSYNRISYRVTSIWERAFENCSSLTSVTIPNGVTRIGYDAFKGCKALSTLTLPNSINSMGTRAFADCKNWQTIRVPQGMKKRFYRMGLFPWNKLVEI